MTKLKKLISFASASCMALTLQAANLTAIESLAEEAPPDYVWLNEKYEQFDDHGIFQEVFQDNYLLWHDTYFYKYRNEYTGELHSGVKYTSCHEDQIIIETINDENTDELIESMESDPDLRSPYVSKWETSEGTQVNIYSCIPGSDRAKNLKTAAYWAKKAKETTNVEKISLITDSHSRRSCPFDLDEIPYGFVDSDDALTKEQFIEYIESLNIDYSLKFDDFKRLEYQWDLVYVDTMVTLIPNGETTLQERFDLVTQIKNDINKLPIIGPIPESGSSESTSIDMANNVSGDANCDGKVTIADSTAILQSIGNEDKYGLSAQGRFNADVSGDFNGVTGEDAIKIQQFDAKIIDSLE